MRRFAAGFILGLSRLPTWVASEPAGNFDVTAEQGEANSCDAACQEAINAGNVADRKLTGTDFDFAFYTTAPNFTTDLEPGEVLKIEPMDPSKLDIKSGTIIYRMQYTTKDIDGSTAPSTGYVAFPYTPDAVPTSENGKYRLMAYAHGAAGLYRACCPSNGPALYDQNTWIPLVERGYAVVATDYAGLGNNYTSHKYIYHPVHAHDLKYSVVAARKLFGGLFTDHWMSMGRSQGGGAVWKLAESEHVRDDSNYLGTVAIAPATYTVDQVLDYISNTGSGMLRRDVDEQDTGYLPFLITAVERALAYKSDILSAKMKKRVELSEKNGLCTRAMLTLTTGVPPLGLVNPDEFIAELHKLKQFQKESSAAQGDRSPAPIMVVQGLNDTTIVPGITERAWKTSCDAGNELHLRLYELMGHKPVQTAAMLEFMGWVDAVFARKTGNSSCGCTSKTRKPLDRMYVKID